MIRASRKYWWRTWRGLHLLRLAWNVFQRGFRDDAGWFLRGSTSRSKHLANQQAAKGDSPLPQRALATQRYPIFLSYCRDEIERGSSKFCGGEKGLNNLCLLLRRHNYEAYMVTWDGSREPWLLETAPTISLQDFQRRFASNPSSQCVTSWIDATAFLLGVDSFYYWDMESAYSDRYQLPEIAQAVRNGHITNFAAFSRTIQGCLMARFDRSVELLPSLVDECHWKPDISKRIAGRVGYFDEGSHSDAALQEVRRVCDVSHVTFFQLQGSELDVLASMQTCEFFLTLNPGKDKLWGEGGPYTPHEALACGTIPLATDILGLRESIIDGFNGYIVPRGRFDLLGCKLAVLLKNSTLCEVLRENGRRHFDSALTMEARWPAVVSFLRLEESR